MLAQRLSSEGASVCLLEAGMDVPPSEVPEDIADPYPRAFYNPSYLWRELTVARTDVAGGQAPFLAARVLGGGSTINGMSNYRGIPDDYDTWEPLHMCNTQAWHGGAARHALSPSRPNRPR